jgi:gas vesicle protein
MDNMSEKNKIVLDTLGDSAPQVDGAPKTKKAYFDKLKGIPKIDPDELNAIQSFVEERLSGCSTHREALEMEINSLAECVGVATEIYKKNPLPDYAYTLAALSNAHKTSLQQFEKMKDPKTMVSEIEFQIRTMFTDIVKAMAIEIDKTKNEMIRVAPEHRTTIEDLISRMLNAIQPETQQIYEHLQKNLKRILGIKVA